MKKGKRSMIITISLVCFLLVMIIFMQFKVVQESQETNIDSMQETELRQELASWKTKYDETKEKYDETVSTLQTYKQESTSDEEKKATLEKELEDLQLILGKTDVEGEGVVITLTEKKDSELGEGEKREPIAAIDLVYIVNYLKDAGAEAISINGERVVTTTAISCDGNVIVVNGKKVNSPIQITAIGLTELLSTLNRPGSTLEYFKENSGKICQ